jgi:hypothetical protein
MHFIFGKRRQEIRSPRGRECRDVRIVERSTPSMFSVLPDPLRKFSTRHVRVHPDIPSSAI